MLKATQTKADTDIKEQELKNTGAADVANIQGGYDLKTTGMRETGKTTRSDKQLAATASAKGEANLKQQQRAGSNELNRVMAMKRQAASDSTILNYLKGKVQMGVITITEAQAICDAAGVNIP
jgi:hypothetical protein